MRDPVEYSFFFKMLFLRNDYDAAALKAYQLEYFEDLIGTVDKWPVYYRDLIFKIKAISREELWKIMIFLMGNGVPPDLIREWLGMKYEMNQRYENLFKANVKGYNDPKYLSKHTVWNVAMGRYWPPVDSDKYRDFEKDIMDRVLMPPPGPTDKMPSIITPSGVQKGYAPMTFPEPMHVPRYYKNKSTLDGVLDEVMDKKFEEEFMDGKHTSLTAEETIRLTNLTQEMDEEMEEEEDAASDTTYVLEGADLDFALRLKKKHV